MGAQMIAVYDILRDGQVVYVGITDNPQVREHQHKSSRRVPRRATLVVVDWFKTRRAALKCERARIRKLKPVLNIQHGECHADDVERIVESMNEKDSPPIYHKTLEHVLAEQIWQPDPSDTRPR